MLSNDAAIACCHALLRIHGDTNLEYGDPGKPDVVEGYGTAVRIGQSGLADGVVLVPVDTRIRRRRTTRGGAMRSVTWDPELRPERDVVSAVRHPVVTLLATDEVHAIRTDVRIRQF